MGRKPPLPRCYNPLFHISRALGPANLSRYFVTDSGITVVTRDYSLFESPVTVDYFSSE